MSQLSQKYTVSVNLFLPSKNKHLKQKLAELREVSDIKSISIQHQGKEYLIPLNALLTKFNRLDIRSDQNDTALTIKGTSISNSLRSWLGPILTQRRTPVIDLDELILLSPKVVSFYESEDLNPEQLCYHVCKLKSTYQPSSLTKQVCQSLNCEDSYKTILKDITDRTVLTTISRLSLATLRHLLPTQPVDIDLSRLYKLYEEISTCDDNLLGSLRLEFLVELQKIHKQLKDVKFPTILFNGRYFSMFVGEPLTGTMALFDMSCLGIEVLLDAYKLLDMIVLSKLLENSESLDLSKFARYEDKTLIVLADIVANVSPVEIIRTIIKTNDVENSFLQTLTREQWQFYHDLDCLKTLSRTTMIKLSEIKQGGSQDGIPRDRSSTHDENK